MSHSNHVVEKAKKFILLQQTFKNICCDLKLVFDQHPDCGLVISETGNLSSKIEVLGYQGAFLFGAAERDRTLVGKMDLVLQGGEKNIIASIYFDANKNWSTDIHLPDWMFHVDNENELVHFFLPFILESFFESKGL